MSKVSIEILHSKSLKEILSVELNSSSTIADVKKAIESKSKLNIHFFQDEFVFKIILFRIIFVSGQTDAA